MDKADIDHKKLFFSSCSARFLVCRNAEGIFSLSGPVNDKALECFGEQAGDFTGKPVDSFVNQADIDVFLSSLAKAEEKKEPAMVRLTVQNSSLTVPFVITPVSSEDGKAGLFDVMALSDDVDDEDAIERERNDAISLLTSVFDVSEVGIIITDRNQRVIRVNDSFVRIYGWERDQVIGHEFTDIVIPEEREIAKKRHEEFMESGIRSSGEMKIARKDGSVANALFTTAALELSHSRTFQVTTIMDITMRKKIEKSLRIAKEQADSASKAKSSFLANMSHELRTPLNAIIGFSEMMVTEIFGALGNEKYKEYLKDIHLSAEHLLEVINEVLDMSKIEAGRLDLVEDPIDVTELISSVSRMLVSRAFSSGVEIKESVQDKIPSLYADPRLLKQILINLVGNSIKFSPAGTVITMEAELLKTGELSLRVLDEGIGIPESRIEEALEPFGQIKRSVQNIAYQGTGLGLPLAKAMVEIHGGRFEVTSKENQGTVVTMVFPVDRVLYPGQKASDMSPLSGFKSKPPIVSHEDVPDKKLAVENE